MTRVPWSARAGVLALVLAVAATAGCKATGLAQDESADLTAACALPSAKGSSALVRSVRFGGDSVCLVGGNA